MVNVQKREGTICEISQDEIIVRIQQLSACTGCHAKEFCCSTDCADRYLRIASPEGDFEVGEQVLILGEDRLGRLAVFLSFILPIIILLASLVLSIYALGVSEPMAVVIAMGVLAVYYLGLRLSDRRLKRIMVFRIQKLNGQGIATDPLEYSVSETKTMKKEQ